MQTLIKPVCNTFRKYPCTMWALTGVTFYQLKISAIFSTYRTTYADLIASRKAELDSTK